MNNVGLSFRIPNRYGNFLSDILKPLPYNDFLWLIENNEIYKIIDDEFLNEGLFKNSNNLLPGDELLKLANSCTQYMIFITLKAFTKNGHIISVRSYNEFLYSDCQIILGVYDCSDVMLWFKDRTLASILYNYFQDKAYDNLSYITEADLLEGKYCLE
ncbi:MAG TPA: DUF2691 family protein [Lachnospiraceae bacterium]|nr:DUF2691 family protein [Lachnospiraceae bacterium]